MARRLTVQEQTKRWEDGAGRASQTYVDGIQSVTENPAQAAIKAAPKYEAGVMEAIREGRYQAGLEGVTLTDWKNAALTKGKANYGNGVKAGAAKMAKHLQDFLPYQAQIQATLDAMPDLTEADRDEKMKKNVELLRQYKKQGRTY